MMIFKIIFKIIIFPFTLVFKLVFKLLSLNPKVTGVMVCVGVIVGIIIYISNSGSGENSGCTSPNDTTGYTNLPNVLPLSGESTIMQDPASCDTNYHGTPQYTCTSTGSQYTLGGCSRKCTLPSDSDLYTFNPNAIGTETNKYIPYDDINGTTLQCNVDYATGNNPSIICNPNTGVTTLTGCRGDSGADCADNSGDGLVSVNDLLSLLAQYGQSGDQSSDNNNDRVVDVSDLLSLLAQYGRGCGDPEDCSNLQNTISSVPGITSQFNGCTENSGSCGATFTCNNTSESSEWTCNNGSWTHTGTSEDFHAINECISNAIGG